MDDLIKAVTIAAICISGVVTFGIFSQAKDTGGLASNTIIDVENITNLDVQTKIIVDTETGVLYLWDWRGGYELMVNADGSPKLYGDLSN